VVYIATDLAHEVGKTYSFTLRVARLAFRWMLDISLLRYIAASLPFSFMIYCLITSRVMTLMHLKHIDISPCSIIFLVQRSLN